jgi:membrane protein DedA with SNARE-associated domain
VDGLLEWLTGLPTGALYVVLALVAAIENVFPPFPADTVVAFGSFLAARGQGTLLGAFLSTLVGNLLGAFLMFLVGRRFGAEPLERRFGGQGAMLKFRLFHDKYGSPALFISRFLPAVRAIVPPAAGALRLPPLRSMILMGTASAIWYGTIAFLGFRLGDDWDRLYAAVRSSTRLMGIIAVGIVVLVVLAFWLRRRFTRERA